MAVRGNNPVSCMCETDTQTTLVLKFVACKQVRCCGCEGDVSTINPRAEVSCLQAGQLSWTGLQSTLVLKFVACKQVSGSGCEGDSHNGGCDHRQRGCSRPAGSL